MLSQRSWLLADAARRAFPRVIFKRLGGLADIMAQQKQPFTERWRIFGLLRLKFMSVISVGIWHIGAVASDNLLGGDGTSPRCFQKQVQTKFCL
jgi:hypothetical protein